MSRPELSIGLPVHNGARYLRTTLESILSQSFGDFELLISDNASSDATESIAREYAAHDRRVRYERNETNLGAVPNYNRVFHRTAGRFFKWAAHDDTLEPQYCETAVELLRAEPGAVLAHTRVRAIDGQGRELRTYDTGLSVAGSDRPSVRFAAAILQPHRCMEIFAVLRREAVLRTSLQLPYHGCDRALVAELALLGRFVHDPRALFNGREHDQQYVRAVSAVDRARWADARAPRRVGTPTWTLYRQYVSAVSRLCEPGTERRRCRLALLRWWTTNWHPARLAVELAAALHPGTHRLADRARRALDPSLGPLPGEPERRDAVGAFEAPRLADGDPRRP